MNLRSQQFSGYIRGPEDETCPQVFLIQLYPMLDPFPSSSTHASSINDGFGGRFELPTLG